MGASHGRKPRCRFAVAPKLAQLRAGDIPEAGAQPFGLRPAENADLTHATFQNRARKLNLKELAAGRGKTCRVYKGPHLPFRVSP